MNTDLVDKAHHHLLEDAVAVDTTPMIVKVGGAEPAAPTELPDGVTSVGRHSASDVLVRDEVVSRRHAEFRREGDVVQVVDLGSLNGTFVNLAPISEPTILEHGDEVRIGKTKLLYLTHLPES